MPQQKNQGPQPGADEAQAGRDNRSQQLNEQDPTFHRSRGESETDSADAARKATQENQQK